MRPRSTKRVRSPERNSQIAGIESLDLESNEFVELLLDGLDHGCHLPGILAN
jgi:hypothetical protein